MKYKAFLIFGAPGSGKGTQGRIIGSIPGFYHLACGDVFRSLDTSSELGQKFLSYSSEGKLVPDDITISLWKEYLSKMQTLGRYKQEIDHLVLVSLLFVNAYKYTKMSLKPYLISMAQINVSPLMQPSFLMKCYGTYFHILRQTNKKVASAGCLSWYR